MNNTGRIGTPMFKTRKKVVGQVKKRTQLKFKMKDNHENIKTVRHFLQEEEEMGSNFVGNSFLASFLERTCNEPPFVKDTGDTLRCSTPVDCFVQKDFIYDNQCVSPIHRLQPSVSRRGVDIARRNLSFDSILKTTVCSTKRTSKSEESLMQKLYEPREPQLPESSFHIRERLGHCDTDLETAASPVHVHPVLNQDVNSLPAEPVLQRQLECLDNYHLTDVEGNKRTSKILRELPLVEENIKTKPSDEINGSEDCLGPEEALLHESPCHTKLQLSEFIGQVVTMSPIPENPLPIRALSPIAEPTRIRRNHPVDDNVESNESTRTSSVTDVIKQETKMKNFEVKKWRRILQRKGGRKINVVETIKNNISPDQIEKCAQSVSQQLCEIEETVYNESPLLVRAQLNHSSNGQEVATGCGLLSPVLVQDSNFQLTETTVQGQRKLPLNDSIGNKKRKNQIEPAVEEPQGSVELRRSKRTCRKPLRYWRNERFQFQKGFGCWEVIGITKPTPRDIRGKRGVHRNGREETNDHQHQRQYEDNVGSESVNTEK